MDSAVQKQQQPHSRVIVGGWQLSAGHHDGFNKDVALATLGTYAAQGWDTVDMGDIYTGVEELVGEYMLLGGQHPAKSKPLRIHTKLVPDLNVLSSIVDWSEYAEAVVLRSINRLNVKALDLVQFHWWDFNVGDHIAAYRGLHRCVEKGLVKRIGLTNYDVTHMSQLLDAGLPVSSNQIQYSVLDARAEEEGGGTTTTMAKTCASNGIGLLCYGVLCGGFLHDRWLDEPEPTLETLENRSLTKYKLIIDEFGGWALFQELLCALRKVADAHANRHAAAQQSEKLETAVGIASVAIAWVLRRPAVAGVILGVRSNGHIQSTIDGTTLVLTPDDLATIDAVRSRRKGPLGAVYGLERDRSGKHGAIMRYNLNRMHTDDFHLPELERRAVAAVERKDFDRIGMLLREVEGFPMTGANSARLAALTSQLRAYI